MQKMILSLFLVSLVAGCSHGYHALAIGKKTKFVSELIEDAKECQVFKDELKSPTMDDDKVDEVYDRATKAHCIKKDV